VILFVMAWSPVRRASTPDDSRLITPETTPPSIPTNPATGPRVTPDYTRLQDAFSSANRLSALATNPIGASPQQLAVAADCSPVYNILDDELAPRHSRPQAPLGSDHSRHCGSFPGNAGAIHRGRPQCSSACLKSANSGSDQESFDHSSASRTLVSGIRSPNACG